MSKVCQITGKKPGRGHSVSHSNRKTNRTYNVNIQKRRVWNPKAKRFEVLKVSTRGLRSMRKWGM